MGVAAARGNVAARYATIQRFAGAAVSEPASPSAVSFVAFVYSLASNAAVHFGDTPEPGATAPRPPDLDAARHVIDLLAMLEQKTRGNLTPDERQFLEQVLYELRMRFVSAATGRAAEP
jgi:hypothetical protein